MDAGSLTDSYLNLLLGFPNMPPNTVLGLFLLTLFRVIPIIMFAPFLGGKNLPNISKMLFGFALAAIFIPAVLMHAKADINFDWKFVGYSIKEITIGFILGFFVAIPFYIAQTSGSLIDHIRGSSALQVTDPSTQTQTGPIGLLYNYVLIAIFYMIGGPFYFFNAITDSFYLIPVDSFFNPIFFSLTTPFWKFVLQLMYTLMSMAIQLAAPSLIGILMTEMFLGIANRLAPQVQIVFLGIPLKSWVGIFFLAIAWTFILKQLGKESLNWVKIMENIIHKVSLLVLRPQ